MTQEALELFSSGKLESFPSMLRVSTNHWLLGGAISLHSVLLAFQSSQVHFLGELKFLVLRQVCFHCGTETL